MTESTTGLTQASGSDFPAIIAPLPAASDFSRLRRGSSVFLVWFGLVWFGLVWFGLVWFGFHLIFSFFRLIVDFKYSLWMMSEF